MYRMCKLSISSEFGYFTQLLFGLPACAITINRLLEKVQSRCNVKINATRSQ